MANSVEYGWEVCVASDAIVRKFVKGIREKPTKKPFLLFVPRGASEMLCIAFLKLLCQLGKVVCLVEDHVTAETLDLVLTGISEDEETDDSTLVENTRLVIGDLESLVKTDADCYGACIVLAYGKMMPCDKLPDGRPTSYLYGRVPLVSKLCGRSAHVLYVEQPFMMTDLLGDCLEKVMKDKSQRKHLGHTVITRMMTGLGMHLARAGRQVTCVGSCLVGSTPAAAMACYIQIFKTSGARHKPRVQDVPSFFIFDEAEAVNSFKERTKIGSKIGSKNDLDQCLFMLPEEYDAWVMKKPEGDQS